MPRKTTSMIVISLLVIGMLTLAFTIQPSRASPTTITVPDNYSTIQAAINAANPGDTVFVKNGTYFENVVVNKTLSLVGESRQKTIVDGRPPAPAHMIAIQITADGVSVNNLTTANDLVGIQVISSYNVISENNIVNSSGLGVCVNYPHNTLERNYVAECVYQGIQLAEANFSVVFGNTIEWCQQGLAINFSLYSKAIQNIIRNNVNSPGDGIFLTGSPFNTFTGNTVTANFHGVGIVGSNDSSFYSNNFNNTIQVHDYAGSPPYDGVPTSHNTWNNSYPLGGNYWSDYGGTDDQSGPSQTLPGYDGIGDVPYVIGGNNTDYYPLMQPLTGLGVLEAQTPAGSNVTVSPMANVTVTFSSVTVAGFTSWNIVQPPTKQFVSVTCNELRTSANYTGNVTLKFAYDPSGLSLQDQQAMKIWLWSDSSSCWIDVTTSVNTTSHTVYGVSPHLSVFGITRDLKMTGDLSVQGETIVSVPTVSPPPPSNLSFLKLYQISTTKNLGTPIDLSLAYDPGNIQLGQEIFTQMWLWNESSTSWVDITSSVNTTTHTVYGISPHLSVFGITNLQSAPDGIAVTNVNCPKTVVCQGYTATIGFTVTNQGDTTQQNFNVLLYCNTTLLATFPIAQLDHNSQMVLSYDWGTTNWVRGNYSVNTCSNSIHWIKVTIVGDVNGDGKVNLIDVFAVALAYGSYPGHPTWNPNYDINNDNKINLMDYFTTALNYGKTDT